MAARRVAGGSKLNLNPGFENQLRVYAGMVRTPLFPAKLRFSFKSPAKRTLLMTRYNTSLRLSYAHHDRYLPPSELVRLPELFPN